MTVTANASTGQPPARPDDLVTVTIDDVDVAVPKGTLIIRAAELLGVQVPRFCDHPLLDPVAACRMCLVEIDGMPKPQPACAVTVSDGMKVHTQLTSEVADTAQKGVMEFLLINHPLDCPICDKGGECPLQNQAMSNGRPQSRFDGVKRTFPKPINISAQILLDRERCVSCARCTRFAEQIAGDPFIELLERGAKQQVGIAEDTPFHSYFSGNTVQICPVGALTSARYRFRARPFDLVSVPTACEHCASGCALRTDYRRTTVVRRLAWDDPQVNEEWNCDKGRFAFPYLEDDRIERPLVRDESGDLRPASWPEAIDAAARGLAAAHGRVGVLTGGRLTVEDAYAYARFARGVLGSDDIDFRARPSSAEEAEFLAARIVGRASATYADLERAPVVLLAGLEPEEESPIVFLRLRKAARRNRTVVASVAALASGTLAKTDGVLLPAVPGGEAAVLDRLAAGGDAAGDDADGVGALLRQPGAVILAGERLATSAGALSAAARLADATGARLAWVPRRAGERGALEAGALRGLLPGGRPLSDPAARADVAAAWGVDASALPAEPGLDGDGIVAAVLADARARAAHAEAADDADAEAPAERVGALLVAGVEPVDTADPAAFLAALDAVPFLVSLETRPSEVTERADVVLPVAVVTEKSGTFVDWEGRARAFAQVLRDALSLPDGRVLAMVADAMDAGFGRGDVAQLRSELSALGAWAGDRPAAPDVPGTTPSAVGAGQAVLASWRLLLDLGRLQEGEPYLAATRREPVARMSAATAQAAGLADGQVVAVATDAGRIDLPLEVADMPDGVVWVPGHSPGSSVHRDLGVVAGTVVRIGPGGDA
ncbi:MAG: NADH-quinone oxidoreductase subunit G [Candidatus Nanopelagicales bacterium]